MGSETLNAYDDPVRYMLAPAVESLSVIRKAAVITEGAVNENENDPETLAGAKLRLPAALEPDGPYVGIEKSVLAVVVGVPEAPMTVMVHVIFSLTRTSVLKPLAWPMQLNVEEVVAAAEKGVVNDLSGAR